MYAVIRTGGKQYRVEHGAQLEVDRIHADEGAEVSLTPVLVVDDGTVLATPSQLGDATVTVKVLGATKGPKIDGFTYKNKTNNRRRWGHRSALTLVEVVSIAAAGKQSKPTPASTGDDAPAAKKAPAKKTPAKKTAAKKTAAKKTAAKKAPAKKAAAEKAPNKDGD